MPILKAIDNPGKSVGTVINYADKDRKKEKNDTLFFGINCADNAEIAAYQMQKTKEFYNKTDGRQYKHYVLSFASNEISIESAKIYAKEFGEQCFGERFEVAVGIHVNSEGGKIHAHFVVNSVSFVDGKKLHFSKEDLENFKNINDCLSKQYGLKVINRSPEAVKARGRPQMYSQKMYWQFTQKIKDSWIAQCSVSVNESLKTNPKNFNEFAEKMKANGWDTQIRGKNITFSCTQNPKLKVRANTLAKRFNNDTLSAANIMRVCNTENWHDFVKTSEQPTLTNNITNVVSAFKNLSQYDNSTSINKGFEVNLHSQDDDYER